MKQHNYQKLSIWNEAIELAVNIYKLTQTFPDVERYGLVNQMRRAGYSVPTNIAEGAGRNSDKSFNQFLNIAQGSLGELHTQLIICGRTDFLSEELSENMIEQVVELKNKIHRFQTKQLGA